MGRPAGVHRSVEARCGGGAEDREGAAFTDFRRLARLYDRSGGRGNLDHIVVGPSGVFLLDSKNLGGAISVVREGLSARFAGTHSQHVDTGLPNAMRGRAKRPKEHIAATTKIVGWVQSVVVVWGNFPDQCVEQDDVVYVAGARLATWLAARPAKLSPRDQLLIELALDAELIAPPATAIPVAAR